MLKHTRTLRSHLAVIGLAGAFAASPLAISPVIAQALNSETENEYRIIESDPNTLEAEHPDETAVEENQVEPYSDKMAAEEPAPTEGDPVAAESEEAPPIDSNVLTQEDDAAPSEPFAQDESAPAQDSFASDADALESVDGVDPMTSAAIPQSGQTDGIYVLEQSDNQIMANRYIGKSVYNDANEKVGDIRDLVFTVDGGIEAVVIGVGGFLGLGQKQVAVHFDEIRIVENPETAELDLYLAANAEQLAEAPEFTTKEDRLAEIRARDAQTSQPDAPLAPAGEPMQ